MNQILVLAKNTETYFIQRLRREVGDSALHFYNPWNENQKPEGHFPTALVRTSSVYGGEHDLDFLDTFHGKIFNPLKSLRSFRNKVLQYQLFEQNQFPHLPWLYVQNSSWPDVESFIQQQIHSNQYLIKPSRGQGGRGIEVFDFSGLKTWFHSNQFRKDQDYILQPYLDDATEYRLFFLDQECYLLERLKGEALVANFTQGQEARIAQLPPDLLEPIYHLIHFSGAFYGAIDFFVKDRQVYILELNLVPGTEQIEAMTGENLTGNLARKLLALL